MKTTLRLPDTTTSYAARCRTQRIVYLLVLLLVVPPQVFFGSVASAGLGTSELQHDTAMESLQNPQFSNAQANRFLYTHSPQSLVGGGGSAFSSPLSRGYRRFAEPETVSLVNGGSVQWSETDLSLPGVGLPLLFERIHRSTVITYAGPLGESWDFNWNKRLELDSGANELTLFDMGRFDIYDTSGGSITSPDGRYDTMTAGMGEYTRADKWGIEETYDQVGSTTWYRLSEIADLNGNTLTFAYDNASHGNLTKVTDTLSQDVTLAYDGSDRITSITDHASREWTYDYDGAYLTAVTTPTVDEAGTSHDFTSGKTTEYRYDAGRLDEVLLPEDTTTGTYRWEYSGSNVAKAWENGSSTIFTHDTGTNTVTVDDRNGDRVRYTYTASEVSNNVSRYPITSRVVEYGGGSSWQTNFDYNADNEVVAVTFPNGNEIRYDFDSDGNVVTVEMHDGPSDASPITWTYSYAANSRLSTLTDPNGETWDYDYDANSNLTKRTAPAVTVPSGIAATDNNGNGTYDGTIADTWAYNGSGLPTSMTDAYGTTTAYEYTQVNSTDAYVQRVIRDTGGGNLNLTRSYAYDGYGNVTSTTDPEGNTTTYTVNALNQVIVRTEPLSITTETFYDANDRVTKVERESDVSQGSDPFVTESFYDQIGNLTKVVEDINASDNLTRLYSYDVADRLTKTTSPEGNVTVTEYDVRDLVTKTTRWIGAAPSMTNQDTVTTIVYDGNGLKTSVTDAEGNVTAYDYDGYDRLTEVTQAEGNYRTMAYDEAGNVTKTTSYNAGSTKLAERTVHFDEANRSYQTDVWAKKADLSTNIGGGTQSKTMWRDELGRVVEFSGDVCGCSLYETVYDAVGRVVTKKDPMGATDPTRNLVINAYDKNGNVTKRTREERTQDATIEASKTIVVEMEYDTRDRMTKRRDKIGASSYADTTYFYGERDQLTKVVDGEGDETRHEYNQQLWKTKDILENGAADVVTEYVYDDEGRMITYKATNSTTGDQITEYTYDRLGRRITTTWPDAGETIQTYDRASNPIRTTQPNGTVVLCAYDDNNRLTAKDMTLASGVLGLDDVDYGYDGLNRLTSVDASEPAGFTSVVERTYNTLGKVETETQVLEGYDSGNGRTITYDWDIDGQKTAVTYPVTGEVVAYTRDSLDRIDVVSRASLQVVDYAYNGGRVIGKEMPGSEAEYRYDTFGRVTNMLHKDTSSGNTLLELDYGYDDAHQVTYQDKAYYDDVQNTRITDNTYDLGDQYGYDGAKRLVTVLRGVDTADIGTALATNRTNGDYDDEVVYTYDQTGNRTALEVTPQGGSTTTTTYAHNTVNEMTTEDGATLTYDANGAYTDSSADSNGFAYNHADQLAEYDDGTDVWTFHFDGLGRRVQRDLDSTGRSVRFYYDGIHCVEQVNELSNNENATKSFVYGSGIDELLEYVDRAPNPDVPYYVHADRLGSVMLLVDTNGAIEESYRYEEFGSTVIVDDTFAEVTVDPHDSPVGNPYRYTGRRQDIMIQQGVADDDWYYSRARNLRTDVGRFVVRDPAGYVDGSGKYSYVAANPIASFDPTGRTSVSGWGGPFKGGIPVPLPTPFPWEPPFGPQPVGGGAPLPPYDDCTWPGGVTCDCTGSCGAVGCSLLRAAYDEALAKGAITWGALEGYQVKCADNGGDLIYEFGCGGYCGCTNVDTQTIAVNLNVADAPSMICFGASLEMVFLHEIGHALGADGSQQGEQQANNFADCVLGFDQEQKWALGALYDPSAGFPPQSNCN